MAASNATTVPVYNQAYRLQFAMYLSTGALNTSPGTLACTLVKDAAAPVASTNAVAEVGTSGVYTLDLTAAEMSYNSLTVIVTSTAGNAVTYTITLNPVQAGFIPADVNSIGGSTAAAAGLKSATLIQLTGTVVTNGSNSASYFETSLTTTTANQFLGRVIVFTSGVNAGAASPILAYAYITSNGYITCAPFPAGAPSAGDAFIII